MRSQGWIGIALLVLIVPAFAPGGVASHVVSPHILPEPLSSSAAATDGQGHVLIAGGVRWNATYSDAIYHFDIPTGEVSLVGKLPGLGPTIPGGRQLSAAAYVGGTYYVIGGIGWREVETNGHVQLIPQDFRDIVQVDVGNRSVQTWVDQLPEGIFGASAATWGGKIYLFGGASLTGPSGPGNLDSVIQIDPSAAIGSRVQTLHERLAMPNSGMGVVARGPQVLLFGGDANNGTANPCPPLAFHSYSGGNANYVYPAHCDVDWIQSLDLSTGQDASVVGHLPEAADFQVAGLIGNDVYLAGGKNASGYPQPWMWRVRWDDPSVGAPVNGTLPVPLATGPGVAYGTEIALFGGMNRATGGITWNVTEATPMDVPDAPFPPTLRPGASGVDASWAAPFRDGDASVTSYTLLGPANETLAQTTGPAWSGTLPSSARTLRVAAQNVLGLGAASLPTRFDPAATIPPAPASLHAVGGPGAITLDWTAVDEADLTGYQILRDGAQLAVVPPTQTRYVDTDVLNGVPHAYEVRAQAPTVDGVPAGPATATAIDAPPAVMGLGAVLSLNPPAEESVRLTWAGTPTAQGYHIYRSEDGGEPTRIANATSTLAFDAFPPGTGKVAYSVAAWNAQGEGPRSAPASVSKVPVPAPPENLTVTTKDGLLHIAWSPVKLPPPFQAIYDIVLTDPSGASSRVAENWTQPSYDAAPDQTGTYAFSVRVSSPLLGPWSAKASGSYAPPDATPTPAPTQANASGAGATPAPVVSTDAPQLAVTVISTSNLTVTAGAQLANMPEGTTLTWDWGDGHQLTGGAMPVHQYAVPGRFTIRLDAQTPAGALYHAQTNVTLEDPAHASAAQSASSTHPTPGPAFALLVVALLTAAGWRRRAG